MLKGYTYEYITNDKGESCMSDANLHNPLTKYDHDEFPKQYQEPPGLQKEMKPVPDCGETSYKGAGKLKGRKALVTGGDSGIGRRRRDCLCPGRGGCGD